MSPEIQTLLDTYGITRPSVFAVLPGLLLLAFAMVVLLADLFELGSTRGPAEGEEGHAIMAPYLSMIGVLAALGAVVWQALRLDEIGGTYFSGMLVLDGFGLFVAGIVLTGTFLTLLLTVGYCRRMNINLAEYYHLILMAALGMILMAQSTNLVMILLGLELLSVAVYILTGFRRTRLASVEGALKYFVLGAFSTGFFVYGIALLYGATGTLDLAAMTDTVRGGPPSALLLAGSALVAIGFAFKVALVPFHMWSPDVYQGAPAPITGFMATGVKAAGFAAFARVVLATFDGLENQWLPVLSVLAILTMFVGNIAAVRQDDIKRLLAYSSIAHAGYLVVALVSHNEIGTAAILYYLAAYTLMTLGAFGVVIVLGDKGEESTSIARDYAGLAWRHPLLAAAMAVFMFSLTGIPPTAGFVGKFSIFSGAVDAGFTWLAALMVVASVISAYYYLKVVVAMYMWSAEGDPVRVRVGPMAGFALVAAIVGIVALGVLPGGWLALARDSVAGLLTGAPTALP